MATFFFILSHSQDQDLDDGGDPTFGPSVSDLPTRVYCQISRMQPALPDSCPAPSSCFIQYNIMTHWPDKTLSHCWQCTDTAAHFFSSRKDRFIGCISRGHWDKNGPHVSCSDCPLGNLWNAQPGSWCWSFFCSGWYVPGSTLLDM